MMRLRKKVVTVSHCESQVLNSASRAATCVLELSPQLQLQLLLQIIFKALLLMMSRIVDYLCQTVHAKVTQLQIIESHSHRLKSLLLSPSRTAPPVTACQPTAGFSMTVTDTGQIKKVPVPHASHHQSQCMSRYSSPQSGRFCHCLGR